MGKAMKSTFGIGGIACKVSVLVLCTGAVPAGFWNKAETEKTSVATPYLEKRRMRGNLVSLVKVSLNPFAKQKPLRKIASQKEKFEVKRRKK